MATVVWLFGDGEGGDGGKRAELYRLLDKAVDARDRGDWTKFDGRSVRLLRALGAGHLLDTDSAQDATESAGFGRMMLVDTGGEG